MLLSVILEKEEQMKARELLSKERFFDLLSIFVDRINIVKT